MEMYSFGGQILQQWMEQDISIFFITSVKVTANRIIFIVFIYRDIFSLNFNPNF